MSTPLPSALLTTSAGSTMNANSLLDFSNNIVSSPRNLYLGPNITVVNNSENGSFSSSLPINTSASVSAYNLNIGVDASGSSASAQLTIDSDGNLITAGKITVRDKVTHKSTLEVDDLTTLKNGLDIFGPLDVSGNATIYGTLDVSGNSTVQQLTVQKAAILNSTLSVVQAATLSSELTVVGKSYLTGGASVSQGLTVSGGSTIDTMHASADIDTSGNMFSNTTYSTYSSSANSNLVVNKKILNQVVENITGSNPATLQAILNLVQAFNTEDETVLNAVLSNQNTINNTLLKKIDYIYHHFFREYSQNIALKTHAGGNIISPDAFVSPVVDISGNIIITGTGGPGTIDTATVNASGTNGVTPDPATTTTSSTTGTV
jgi:hypothetical protein